MFGLERETRKGERLKTDVNKAIDSLSDIYERIKVKAKTDKYAEEIADDLKKTFKYLRKEGVQGFKKMDRSLRKNPYSYLTGALALGFLFGILGVISMRTNSRNQTNKLDV